MGKERKLWEEWRRWLLGAGSVRWSAGCVGWGMEWEVATEGLGRQSIELVVGAGGGGGGGVHYKRKAGTGGWGHGKANGVRKHQARQKSGVMGHMSSSA